MTSQINVISGLLGALGGLLVGAGLVSQIHDRGNNVPLVVAGVAGGGLVGGLAVLALSNSSSYMQARGKEEGSDEPLDDLAQVADRQEFEHELNILTSRGDHPLVAQLYARARRGEVISIEEIESIQRLLETAQQRATDRSDDRLQVDLSLEEDEAWVDTDPVAAPAAPAAPPRPPGSPVSELPSHLQM